MIQEKVDRLIQRLDELVIIKSRFRDAITQNPESLDKAITILCDQILGEIDGSTQQAE